MSLFRENMRGGTIAAGVISLLLGLAGLMELFGTPVLPFSLAIVSAFLTTFGTLVLFGAITLIGLGLIVTGLVTSDTRIAVRETHYHTESVAPAIGAPVVYETLELTVLRHIANRRSINEIAKITGVSRSTISQKLAKLSADGYVSKRSVLSGRYTVTEKGYDALRRAETREPLKPTL